MNYLILIADDSDNRDIYEKNFSFYFDYETNKLGLVFDRCSNLLGIKILWIIDSSFLSTTVRQLPTPMNSINHPLYRFEYLEFCFFEKNWREVEAPSYQTPAILNLSHSFESCFLNLRKFIVQRASNTFSSLPIIIFECDYTTKDDTAFCRATSPLLKTIKIVHCDNVINEACLKYIMSGYFACLEELYLYVTMEDTVQRILFGIS